MSLWSSVQSSWGRLLVCAAVPVICGWFVCASPAIAFAAGNDAPRLRVESTLSYEHFSRNKVILRGVSFFDVLHIGEFEVRRMKRDVVTLNTRVGYLLSPQMRLEAVVPLRYRRELVASERESDTAIRDEDSRPPRFQEFQGAGLGDVEMTLYLALPPAELNRVFTIGIKAPTGRSPYEVPENGVALGSGHWSAQLGLHLQKAIDPVVLFGSFGYTYSFGREGMLPGDKEPRWRLPGSSIRYTLGLAMAINPRVALTAMFEHIFTQPMMLGEEVLRQTEANSAVLSLGVLYQWASGRAMRVQVGLGLTEDSPDFSVTAELPFSFQW